jgi:integrase
VAHLEDRWERADRKGTGKRWRVRYTDPAGKERSRSFDRKADATTFLNATAADVARGTWVDPAAGKLTLRAYIEQTYLPSQVTEATTIQAVESRFRTRILPGLGDYTLGQLASQPSVIRNWMTGLRAELADSTVRVLMAALSAALNAAVTDGLIPKNPCGQVRLPKAAAGRVKPWPAAWATGMREALPGRYAGLIDAASGLGLRQGELFGLAAEDIDWLRRVVHVRRQLRIVANTLVLALPKGGKERDVPLPDAVALRLSQHIAAYPPAAVTLPWKVPTGKPVTVSLLFTTPGGAALHRSSFNVGVWQPALREGDIPSDRENGMHALRHYYASVLLARGVDIRALAAYLGHTDPGFTLRVYTHLMPSADDRARQAIDAEFSAPDGPGTAQAGGNP